MIYVLGAIGIAGVALAVYERRKGLKMREDSVLPDRANRHVDPIAQAHKTVIHKGDGRID